MSGLAKARAEARLFSDAADNWRETVRSAPGSFMLLLLLLGIPSVAYAPFGILVTVAVFGGWLAVQVLLRWQRSCCRDTGLASVALVSASLLFSAGSRPPQLPPLLFKLPLCANASAGTRPFATFGLRGQEAKGLRGACPTAPLKLHLGAGDGLEVGADYRAVLFLPSDPPTYARVVLSASDAQGLYHFPPTELEVGPDDGGPWEAEDKARATTSSPSDEEAEAVSDLVEPGDAAQKASSAGGISRLVPPEGRRLKGGFARPSAVSNSMGNRLGAGTFSSPHRAASPSWVGGNAPVVGRRVVTGAAVGHPAVYPRYYGGRPIGLGFYPTAHIGFVYHPLSHLYTTLAVAHVLRLNHNHHHTSQSHLTGMMAAMDSVTEERDAPSFFYGARAVPAGTSMRVIPAQGADSLSKARPFGKHADKSPLDEYQFVRPEIVSLSGALPLYLTLNNATLYQHTVGAKQSVNPVLLIGLVRTDDPHSGLRSLQSRLWSWAWWLMVMTAVVSSLGLVSSDSRPPSRAGSAAGSPSVSADGELLGVGSRVQTQYTVDEGGDDEWYAGTITVLHAGGRATIVYDDGDEWTGSLREIYSLRHGDDDGEDEESGRHYPGEGASAEPPPAQAWAAQERGTGPIAIGVPLGTPM